MGAYLSRSDLEDLERGLYANNSRSRKEIYCIYNVLLVYFHSKYTIYVAR